MFCGGGDGSVSQCVPSKKLRVVQDQDRIQVPEGVGKRRPRAQLLNERSDFSSSGVLRQI